VGGTNGRCLTYLRSPGITQKSHLGFAFFQKLSLERPALNWRIGRGCRCKVFPYRISYTVRRTLYVHTFFVHKVQYEVHLSESRMSAPSWGGADGISSTHGHGGASGKKTWQNPIAAEDGSFPPFSTLPRHLPCPLRSRWASFPHPSLPVALLDGRRKAGRDNEGLNNELYREASRDSGYRPVT